jgi:hypothetical protein
LGGDAKPTAMTKPKTAIPTFFNMLEPQELICVSQAQEAFLLPE